MYICTGIYQNTQMTKRLLLIATIGLLIASCAPETETYQLDESSSLNWMGQESANHKQNGTLTFSEGSITVQGDDVIEGSFKIDMKSIKVTTEGLPEEKAGYLLEHLQGEDFFMIDKFPTIDVTVSGYSEGKLSTTVKVLGVDLTNDIPVKLEKEKGEVRITGKFSLDISSTKLAYLKEKNSETGEPALNPNLEFDLALVLKK